jgi:hypothetical protein
MIFLSSVRLIVTGTCHDNARPSSHYTMKAGIHLIESSGAREHSDSGRTGRVRAAGSGVAITLFSSISALFTVERRDFV